MTERRQRVRRAIAGDRSGLRRAGRPAVPCWRCSRADRRNHSARRAFQRHARRPVPGARAARCRGLGGTGGGRGGGPGGGGCPAPGGPPGAARPPPCRRGGGGAVAPGAATYALPGGTHEGPFSHGFDAGVAEPGGGATLATSEPGKGLVLMRVTGAGVIDRNFGVAGRAHVPVPSDRDVNDPAPVQVSRLADGRGLVVGYGQDVPYSTGAPQLVVTRPIADGRLDLRYGAGGRAQPGVETGCYCSAAAVLTDGRFALTGQTAGRWTVAVLTPDGGLDTAFGSDGIATVAADGLGFAAAPAPNGGVVVLGMVDRNVQLSELTAAGAPDRVF